MASRKANTQGFNGLCVGCLFSLSTLGNFIVTPCCKRELCSNCLETLPSCPVCRVSIDRSLIGTTSPAAPPPYFAAFPPSNPNPPTYQSEADSQPAVRGASGGEGALEDEEEVPSYDFNPHSASFLDIAELETTEAGISAIHYISSHDTLVGISLKYNVPVAEIRRANKMFSSNIHEKEKLIIPGVNRLPKNMSDPSDEMKEAREKVRKTKRFQMATKCIDDTEANYYLEECKFDVDQAIQRYEADVEWEKTHKVPSGRVSRSRTIGSSAPPTSSPSTASASSSASSSSLEFPFFSFSSGSTRSKSFSFGASSRPEMMQKHKDTRIFGLF